MTKIGAYELKTHVSWVIRRLEEGESFLLTHHGRSVGHVTPIPPKAEDLRAKKAKIWKALRGNESKTFVDADEIRTLIDEGRKY